jgi:hypothetical protein
VLVLAVAGVASAGNDWSRVVVEILGPSTLEQNVHQLVDGIGGRVSGSEANRRSVEWAVEAFRRAGVDSVATEALTLPVGWREGRTHAEVVGPVSFPLRAVSVAWSPPTPAGAVEAPVVDLGFGSKEEFARVADRLEGAWLLVNRAVLETWDDLFAEYANAPPVLERAVAAGAIGVLWISTKEQGVLYRHINTHGEVDVLPQAIVAREDGLRIARLASRNREVRVRLEMPNEVGGPFDVENVIAEIRGGDKADEIVAVGAHLDSWDLGTGALDNGANVALVIEVARAIRAAGIHPRRTLRFMLWNGEEQGLRGSRSYVTRHRNELDGFVAYLNIDGGIGSVNGFAVAGRPEVLTAIEEVMAPLEEWGVTEHLLDTYGGSDHVDFLLEGIPILDANQPVANYLANYHASSDTLDKVSLRDLRLNAAVMATAILGISEREERVGSRLSRAEVEALVQDTGFASYLEEEGIWEEFLAGTRGRALETSGAD